MSDDVTSDEWSSSAKPAGPVSSTTPTSSMASTAVIASVTVVGVILVAVAIAVLLFCLYRRRKQARNQNMADEIRPKSSHGSSTIRSDKSDHPYENPSLPRKLRANHAAKQASKPGIRQDTDPYAPLKGHSLPHHYQGLGQKPEPLDESAVYDELMASSEGNNSDYYFKLEAGSRSNTGVRPGVQPVAQPAVDPTDPDQADDLVQVGNTTGNNANRNEDRSNKSDIDKQPYDLVEFGNTTGNNANRNEDRSNKSDIDKEPYDLVEVGNTTGNNSNRNLDRSNKSDTGKENVNPHYFQVDRSQGGSFTAPASVHSDQASNNDKHSPSDKAQHVGDETNAKPTIAAKPNLATKSPVKQRANSYDKLDRSTLSTPKTEDINANEYDKLLPQLAVQSPNVGPASSEGYMKVNIGNDVDGTEVDSLTGVNDYNKLERGVEKEMDNLIVADENSSTV